MRILYKYVSLILENVLKYRYSFILHNVTRAFPHIRPFVANRMVFEYYKYFGQLICEFVISPLPKLEIDIKTLQKLNFLLSKNKPVVLVLGHYGNWEILNQLPLHIRNVSISCIYTPIKNVLGNFLINKFRTRYGIKLIQATNIRKVMLANSLKGEIFICVNGQNSTNFSCLEVEFLNHFTEISTDAEEVGKILNAYVAYIEISHQNANEWMLKMIPICDEAKLTYSGEITRKYTELFERSIYNNPSFYLWSH